MMESEDILHQFQMINNKLKKKFMRRVNIAEPSDQFSALSIQCENNELPQYAGLCWTAVVNCEEMRHNSVEAAIASVKAGNQFVLAHEHVNSFGGFKPSDEYLQAAMNYYNRSIAFTKGHILEKPLNSKVLCTAGSILDKNGKYEEAASWLQKAVDLEADSPSKLLPLLENLISEMIKSNNYPGALQNCNKIIETVNKLSPSHFGIYSDILLRYEITIILLLLILKPNPRKLPTIFSNILEKYTWIEDSFGCTQSILPDNVFFLLQSLVMSCQMKNVKDMYSIEKEIVPYLTEDQICLFTELILSMS